MSRILEAAVKLWTGEVVTGISHRDIWNMILAGNGYEEIPKHRYREGFVTDEGKFVNRFTAATIARLAGQIPQGLGFPREGLHSSDLC